MKLATIAFTVALSLMGGCARPGFTPVKDPTVRIDSYGFSILPPQGLGWYRSPDIHLGSSDGVGFARQGSAGTATHTVAVTVMRHSDFNPALAGFADYATKIEVFTAYVKSGVEHANPPGGRARILELSAVPDMQHGYGVEGYSKFEDRGAPSGGQVLIMEAWSVTCLHPDSPQVLIEAVFSERCLPGEKDPSLKEVREQFFKSLQFLPLR